MHLINVKESLIKTLALLIAAQSVCTLVFESILVFGSNSGFQLYLSSFMIGGEISLSGIALCLLTFKYFATSLETPKQIRLPNGHLRVQL